MDHGELTAKEAEDMIVRVRSLPKGQGRKAYKMTRRMYDELIIANGTDDDTKQ